MIIKILAISGYANMEKKKNRLKLTLEIYSQSTQVFQYRSAFTIQDCNH